MTNELLTKPVTYEVNGEEIKLTGNMVKQYLVSGNGNVTDQEIVLFLNLCKFNHLNPFLNEAYLVKFGSSAASMIVSKEAFMKRAENHPQYNGFKAGIVVERNGELIELPGALKLPKDRLIGGWAKVFRKDRAEAIEVQIDLSEFSKSQATWKSMPNTMIRKSAIVNALREAFPESLGAMYTEDDKNPAIKDVSGNVTPQAEKAAVLESSLFEKPQGLPEQTTADFRKMPEVSESIEEKITEGISRPISREKHDDRGHEIKTYEGYTGFIAPEVKEYFKERYESSGIRVVPGHWPSMETKEDVDEWIDSLNEMKEALKEKRSEKQESNNEPVQETLDIIPNFGREDVTPNDENEAGSYPF